LAAHGTTVTAMVRGKPVSGTISPLPFVPHRYVRKS
jgi:aminomethyltransferase